jgi:hypothetical protein
MKRLSVWCVVVLCVVACATVAAVEVWPAARHVRTEDQNGDGRPDVWRHYDNRWQLIEIDVDSNFDGSPDIEEYYERGVLVRRESDRDFNGQADLIEEFDARTRGRIRSVVDIDYDGVADLLVLFQDGRPVRLERTSSPRRTGIPTKPSADLDQRGARRLARLTNPFDSDTVVRAEHPPSTADVCVGLSTSGGLPRPRVTLIGSMSQSARLAAHEAHAHALILVPRRSSRAPPASPLDTF